MIPFVSPMMNSSGVSVLSSPLDLFTGGVKGAWWDPSDLSHMWKDTAGTSPVTADGDLVARIDDKSGNGNHLLQSSAINRPKYKSVSGHQYLLMDDSTGDWMIMQVGFPSAFGTTWSRVSGFNEQGGTAGGGNGHLYSDAGTGAGDLSVWNDGLGVAMRTPAATGPRAAIGVNVDAVLTELWANPAPCQAAFDNGAYVSTPSIAGAACRGLALGYYWALGADHCKMKWHGATMIDRALTGPEIAFLRTYYGAKQGRTL